ncbi:hypothetical protein LNQ03_21840 [Klebsiella pneumoniae subsp. pneumoniae]|nr:hypothetical protein [Klebsiella pneumoniae subsp. pneumoniae]
MTKLGEHQDITLDVSRRIYEAARQALPRLIHLSPYVKQTPGRGVFTTVFSYFPSRLNATPRRILLRRVH